MGPVEEYGQGDPLTVATVAGCARSLFQMVRPGDRWEAMISQHRSMEGLSSP